MGQICWQALRTSSISSACVTIPLTVHLLPCYQYYETEVQLRRIHLPRTSVNKGKRKARSKNPALLITASDLPLVGRLLQACGLLLRLARGLASIFERHAGERFSPLLEEALVCFVALLKDLKDLGSKRLVGLRLTLHALGDGLRDLLGYLVVPLAGGDPVLRGYLGAFLGALGVTLGDPAQVFEILLGHRGRGHFIDTSVGSGLVQFQTHAFTVELAQLNIRSLFAWLWGAAKAE